MTRLRTSLSRADTRSPMDRAELRSAAAAAWHSRGVLVVLSEDMSPEAETIGSKLYGRRDEDRRKIRAAAEDVFRNLRRAGMR